jgi:septal ring factor EnvC (AmiA/AmiB activator)
MKQMQTLQTHLKKTKTKVKDLETHLEQYEAREKQFVSAIGKVLDMAANRPADDMTVVEDGLDAEQVDIMARKIAREYLHMDWPSVLSSSISSRDLKINLTDLYMR